MTHKQNTTYVRDGFVRTDAVRGALTRRRQARAETTVATRRASRPTVLRRWSVAQLVAKGVSRPPAGQTAQ